MIIPRAFYFIAVSGRLGSGKTTFCKEMELLFRTYTNALPITFSFADTVRKEIGKVLGMPNYNDLKQQAVKERALAYYIKGDIREKLPKDFPADKLEENDTVRHFMQLWGTDYRRNQDPYYWVKATRNRINSEISDMAFTYGDEPNRPIVVMSDDVRFPNELALFKSLADKTSNSKYYSIYLRYPVTANTRDADRAFLPQSSMCGGFPRKGEHPSEYSLDILPADMPHLFTMIMQPSYGRIPAYALIAFNKIMEYA